MLLQTPFDPDNNDFPFPASEKFNSQSAFPLQLQSTNLKDILSVESIKFIYVTNTSLMVSCMLCCRNLRARQSYLSSRNNIKNKRSILCTPPSYLRISRQ